MISDIEFDALVTTYARYEWVLRRIVLAEDSLRPSSTPASVPVVSGILDAVWFSREPADGAIAWEVRYLGPTQYALVEHLDEDEPDFEEKLREVEARLADAVAAKRFA